MVVGALTHLDYLCGMLYFRCNRCMGAEPMSKGILGIGITIALCLAALTACNGPREPTVKPIVAIVHVKIA
jgi:hypothetical protein